MSPHERSVVDDAGRPPLYVIALGGNAVSPPRGDLSFATERVAIDGAAAELAAFARTGARLLVVHGNGPQVGRLLGAGGLGDPECLDVHVAQTQGELGYLLAEALDVRLGRDACAALVTRVLVEEQDPAFAHPTKPIGAVLAAAPTGGPAARAPDGSGWRRVVASPRPVKVIEQPAIASLLATHHVIAGGGGGVPLVGSGSARRARPAVIDKDWVAALLASALSAEGLVFVTDVSHAFERFGQADQREIHAMSVAEARARLDAGMFAPGSMAPKVESAVQFVEATRHPAVITTIGSLERALRGATGTTIRP
jgi:carbamate kinase